MIEGMPMIATSTPLKKPIAAPTRTARQREQPDQQVRGEAAGGLRVEREGHELAQHREHDAGHLDDRREREVDLAGGDDQGQAEADDQRRRHGGQERQIDPRALEAVRAR